MKRQFEEQFLAVIRKGTYRLTDEFEFLEVEEREYYQMSSSQKKKLRKRPFESSVTDLQKPAVGSPRNDCDDDKELSINAEQTGLLIHPISL